MGSIRLLFSPLWNRQGRPREVKGGRLSLTAFGAGQSRATPERQPAELEFYGRSMARVRGERAKAFERIGRLPGEIQLAGRGYHPRFFLDPKGEIQYEEAPPPGGEPSRQLQLDFEPTHFEGIPELSSPVRRLRLPSSSTAPEARHFEVAVALRIAGVEEAPFEKNDVLDVPLARLRVGLVLEWPDVLDEAVPLGLTLVVKQGGVERTLSWASGSVEAGRRLFLFRNIVGPSPVDLFAHVAGQVFALWQGQDISAPDVPPTWTQTLEQVIRLPRQSARSGEFVATGALPSESVQVESVPETTFRL